MDQRLTNRINELCARAVELLIRDFFEFFEKTVKGFAVGNVERKRRGFASGLFDLFHNVFSVRLFAVVGQDHIISLGPDIQGHTLTQTAASAGYETWRLDVYAWASAN